MMFPRGRSRIPATGHPRHCCFHLGIWGNHAAAEKQLATVEEQMVKPKTTLSQAIEAGLQADRAEHDAQLQEIDAWQALFEAQQAMKRIEVGYRAIEIDFLGKQSAANAVRQKMARAKRDGDLAIGQIGILEPILQEKLEK